MCVWIGVLPLQLASSASAAVLNMQPRTSAREQSGASFSHVLNAFSNGAEQDAPRNAKASRQTNDDQAEHSDDLNNAFTAPVAQPPIFLLSSVFALLHREQAGAAPEAESADPEKNSKTAQLTNAPTAAEADPDLETEVMAHASLPAAQTAEPVSAKGPAKGAATRAASATQPNYLHASSFVPTALQIADELPDAIAESQTPTTAGSIAVGSGEITAQAGASQSCGAAAAGLAAHPLAFTMAVSAEQDSADANATGEATAMAGAGSGTLNALSTAVSAAAVKAAAPADAAGAPNVSGGPASSSLFPSFAGPAARTAEDRSLQAEPAAAHPVSDVDSDTDTAAKASVRNLQVQVDGDQSQRVDVRITEQGGALRVSVRSQDATLTQALQDHMPELTNRLAQQHFNAAVWIPRPANASEPGASNGRSFHSHSGDTSGQDQSGRRQNGRQNGFYDWLEDDTPQTGAKEKLTQTWLQ